MSELKELLHRPIDGAVDWCGVVVKFSANRAAHTHEYEKRLRQAITKAREEGEEASVHEFYAVALPPLLISWDLEDDGKPVPIAAEALFALPFPFLQALADKITELSRPFAATQKPEPSGSFS